MIHFEQLENPGWVLGLANGPVCADTSHKAGSKSAGCALTNPLSKTTH